MKKFLFIILCILSINSYSQKWSFGVRSGYGYYFMSSLKDLQEFRLEQSELPLKTTENYPISPYYRAELTFNELKLADRLGVFYTYNSTGARSTLSDYSGHVDFDAIINGNQLGITIQKAIKSVSNYSLGIYGDGAFIFSKLKLKDYLKLTGTTDIVQKEEYYFNSKGGTAELGMFLKYRLSVFEFQLTAGFQKDYPGKLRLDENKDQWLAIEKRSIRTGWDGFCLGLQTSVYFGKKESE